MELFCHNELSKSVAHEYGGIKFCRKQVRHRCGLSSKYFLIEKKNKIKAQIFFEQGVLTENYQVKITK